MNAATRQTKAKPDVDLLLFQAQSVARLLRGAAENKLREGERFRADVTNGCDVIDELIEQALAAI